MKSLKFLMLAFLLSCSEETQETLPKYSTKTPRVSGKLATWRVIIEDSVVTKQSLLDLANKVKQETNTPLTMVHFYPSGGDTTNTSQYRIFFPESGEIEQVDQTESYTYISKKTFKIK